MSGDRDLVVATVREIVAGHPPADVTAERPWDAGLWADLAGSGMTGVGLPEDAGGSGGEAADAVAVVAAVAAGAGAVPLAEHLLVAGPAVVAAGLPLPPVEEPLTVALSGVTADRAGDGWLLSGTAPDVPWVPVASAVVVLADGPDGPLLAVVPAADLAAATVPNLAGEPRSAVAFEGVVAVAEAAAPVGALQADLLRARFALARAVQLAAALEEVLAWTVRYAGERHQFGRPLGAFQAVQTQLAEMAGEVVAVTAVVDAAAGALDRAADLPLAAAVAKVRAGAAVEVVARRAHQVHGAIGFTQEHRLHHLTRRCWAWRDEAGSETAWARVLGAGLLADGPDDLWAALTRVV